MQEGERTSRPAPRQVLDRLGRHPLQEVDVLVGLQIEQAIQSAHRIQVETREEGRTWKRVSCSWVDRVGRYKTGCGGTAQRNSLVSDELRPWCETKTYKDIHVVEHSVVGEQVVGHSHSMRLHGVAQSVVEVANIVCTRRR